MFIRMLRFFLFFLFSFSFLGMSDVSENQNTLTRKKRRGNANGLWSLFLSCGLCDSSVEGQSPL